MGGDLSRFFESCWGDKCNPFYAPLGELLVMYVSDRDAAAQTQFIEKSTNLLRDMRQSDKKMASIARALQTVVESERVRMPDDTSYEQFSEICKNDACNPFYVRLGELLVMYVSNRDQATHEQFIEKSITLFRDMRHQGGQIAIVARAIRAVFQIEMDRYKRDPTVASVKRPRQSVHNERPSKWYRLNTGEPDTESDSEPSDSDMDTDTDEMWDHGRSHREVHKRNIPGGNEEQTKRRRTDLNEPKKSTSTSMGTRSSQERLPYQIHYDRLHHDAYPNAFDRQDSRVERVERKRARSIDNARHVQTRYS